MKKELCSLTISMAILALFVTLASAQEPSPAGGRFVSFVDGGFAVALDDEAFDEGMESFMIEAWIYLTERPEGPLKHQIIASKRGSYELALTQGEGGTRCYRELVAQNLKGVGTLSGTFSNGDPSGRGEEFLIPDRWHHIGIGFSGSPSTWVILYDGAASFIEGPPWGNNKTIFDSHTSLYIGGMERDDRGCHPRKNHGSFPGYIDEVRISDVLRYLDIDIPDLIKHWQAGEWVMSILYDPPGRFENDEHTRGLWHFDDGEGKTEFRDSSGNNNTLIGKNDAAIGGAFAVEPLSKLLITWGKAKSKY